MRYAQTAPKTGVIANQSCAFGADAFRCPLDWNQVAPAPERREEASRRPVHYGACARTRRGKAAHGEGEEERGEEERGEVQG